MKKMYLCLSKRTLIYLHMKRKDLKKHINYLCGVLGIAKMQNDWICRLSHVEPGSKKLFFKKLKEDMQKRTDEIIDQIQNL